MSKLRLSHPPVPKLRCVVRIVPLRLSHPPVPKLRCVVRIVTQNATASHLFCLDSAGPPYEARARNRERRVHGADSECCICWRPLRTTAKTTYVEMVEGGGLAYPQDGEPADTDDAGYLGCHAVGPRCARLVPSRYHVGCSGSSGYLGEALRCAEGAKP